MEESDDNNVEACSLSYYRRKKANKRAADEDVEDLYSEQNREIPVLKKKNEKVSEASKSTEMQSTIATKCEHPMIPHQEEEEALDHQLRANILQIPFADAVLFQEDVRTEEEWQKFDEELGEPIISEEEEDANEDDKEVDPSVYLPLLSVAFYLSEGMSKSALSNHLAILHIGTKQAHPALRSPYMLLSKYNHLKSDIGKIYVCRMKNCSAVLVTEGDKPALKQPCSHHYPRKPLKDCFVIKMPVEKQLKYFIERYGLDDSSEQPDPNIRGDVNTGSYFRELRDNGLINDRTITLQLNGDGAPVHKTSPYSIWPLMGIINEAKYKLRRNYVVLIALWYGSKKPPTKPYLEWAMQELSRLQEDGFSVGGVTYFVRVVIVTTDTVARPILRCTSQFNGEFGCDICLHPGKVVKVGRGHSRVYPEKKGIIHSLRTLKQHDDDLLKIENSKRKERVHGIIGPTPLAIIPGFDYIRAFIPEYMHSFCLGVIKYFIVLWTSPKHSKKPWSLVKKMKVINARLRNCTPSYEVTRSFDSLDDLSNWKASMYRSFALFFYVILEDQLPTEYFEHFRDLSYGLFVLLQEKVSVSSIKKVEALFRRFVIDAERLYAGEEHIKINLHFLTHLPECVINWGCLWAHSCFIPEWFNGILLKLFSGTQHVATQMAENHMINVAVREEVIHLLSTKHVPPKVAALFGELLHLPNSDVSYSSGMLTNEDTVRVLGRGTSRDITIEEEVSLRNMFAISNLTDFQSLPLISARFYERFQLVSTRSIFTTFKYSRSPKRLNYCALLTDGSFFQVDNIILLDTPNSSNTFVIGKELGAISKSTYLPKADDGGVSFDPIPGQTTKLVGKSESLRAIDPSFIASKCVVGISFALSDTVIATALPNSVETD